MIRHIRLLEHTKLHEAAVKSLADMSQEEYDELIDRINDLADEVDPVDYVSDMDARIAKIKADRDDPVKNAELKAEDDEYLRPERDAKRALAAKEREQKRYQRQRANGVGFARLKQDILDAIADQVKEYEEEEESWQDLDRRHDYDPNIVVKGKHMEEKHRIEIPTLDVFLDYSISWSANDLKKGREVVAQLQDYVDDGLLKMNIFYFTNNIATTPEAARREYGTSTGAWEFIQQQVLDSGARNVFIMTDDDMETQGDHDRKVLVDGCVWYLWNKGLRAPRLLKELRGLQGTYEYQM